MPSRKASSLTVPRLAPTSSPTRVRYAFRVDEGYGNLGLSLVPFPRRRCYRGASYFAQRGRGPGEMLPWQGYRGPYGGLTTRKAMGFSVQTAAQTCLCTTPRFSPTATRA